LSAEALIFRRQQLQISRLAGIIRLYHVIITLHYGRYQIKFTVYHIRSERRYAVDEVIIA